MLRNLLGVLLLFMFSLCAFGQEEESSQPSDRFTYDVAADPESVSANMLQILQKLPFVTINASNEVAIPSSSQVVLYINGLPQSGYSIGEYLQTLPASRVERVEIYTQPKASEQLTGDAGLINIITKKQEGEGTTLAVTAHGATSTLAGADLLLNIRKNKFFFDGGYSFSYQDKYSTTWKDAYTPSIETQYRYINQHNASLHTGFELTEKDIIGATLTMICKEESRRFELIESDDMVALTSQPVYNLATYYKHTFAKGAFLKLTYEYNHGESTLETFNEMYSNPLKENNFQIDFSTPINNISSFEVGGRYSIHKANFIYKINQNNIQMEEEEKNKSNSWTVYTQYTIRFAKLQLNVGLLGNNSDDEGRSFCLSPYTTLNWDINDKQSISFQYNLQRIQPTYMNSSLIDHKPLHKVDVNYHYTYRKLQLMADANYSLSPSCRLPAFYGVYYSVDERMKFQQILLSLYARYALAPSVSVYGGGMFTRQRIDYDNARNEKSQNANCGQLSAGSDIHFTPSFCLAINGGYYFPQKTENISGTQNYFYRANLSKEFANKRWKAAIYANDFFGKKKIKSYYKDIYSPQTVMRYTLPTNEFGVSLTYRIL